MRTSHTLLTGAVALLGMIGLACGGSGDSEPAAAKTTTGAAAAITAAPPVKLDAPLLVNGLPACVPPGSEIAGSPFSPNADPIKGGGGAAGISLVPAAGDIAKGDSNLVLGVTDVAGQPIGDAKVRLTIYDLDAASGRQTPFCQVEPVVGAPGTEVAFVHTHADGSAHTHGGENPERGAYYSHVRFPRAGAYGVAAEAILKDGTRKMATLLLQVAEKPSVPAVGDQAPRSDNLTKADVKNISEIDSGSPPNDMHDLKIKDVIAAGRPLVVVFSTPAYCTSAFCGPVNQEVEVLHDQYAGQVDFVHIEIWRDRTAGVLNPTAREWLLRPDGGLMEPFVYVIDKNGVIFDRWEGPVARNIMEASVKAVASGATYKP